VAFVVMDGENRWNFNRLVAGDTETPFASEGVGEAAHFSSFGVSNTVKPFSSVIHEWNVAFVVIFSVSGGWYWWFVAIVTKSPFRFIVLF